MSTNRRSDTQPDTGTDTGTKDSQISMRLPAELKDRVETYARMTGRSKSYVATAALGEYLDWRLPQIQDLQVAIAAADRGEFATEADVAAVLARYDVTADTAKPAAAPKNQSAAQAATTVAAKRKRA